MNTFWINPMSEPNPYGHLGEEAFNRLPESVKEEMRQKMQQAQTNAVLYREKLKQRAWQGAVLGGLASVILAYALGDWPFIIPMTVAGAIGGLIVVRAGLSHITAMLLMGGIGIAGTLLGYSFGLVGAFITNAFFSWMMWSVTGVLIAKIMEGDRSKRDTF
jgi:hypothetical protein